MKVFLTGTENLKSLDINPEIKERIDNICRLNAEILIGNYRGFDRLALAYLRSLNYPNVTVYETGSKLNFGYNLVNVGRYPLQDIRMSELADFMLAVHDGSKGVERNLKRMPANKIRLIRV
ncbi:hypothetical protein ACE1CD_15490 [Aerosakkonema sp. BLCC-F183]